MTDISTLKFFKFLDTQKNWFEKADTNSDDVVIKAEFRQFLNAESSSFKAITGVPVGEDIINKFWNQLDTSKENKKLEGHKLKDLNAVGKNTDEFKNISCNIESLNVLEKFYQTHVIKDTPNFLNKDRQQVWRNLVYAELENEVNTFIANTDNKNTTITEAALAAKYAEVKNTITADECDDYYFAQLKQSVLKEYAQYNIEEDCNVMNIVDSYIRNVDRNISTEEVLNGMKALIDAYLAHAGFTGFNSNTELLAKHGYTQSDNSYLNDLQKAVLTKRLTESLYTQINGNAEVKAIYEANKASLDNTIENTIKEIVETTLFKDFSNVTIDISVITSTDIYENAKNRAQILPILTLDNKEFYNALKTKLGFDDQEANTKMPEAFEILQQISEYNEAINEICNNTDGYLKSDGTIDFQKVIEKVLEKVKDKVLMSMSYDVNSSMTSNKLKTCYSDASEDASHMDSNESKLERERLIAIKTCNAILQKQDNRYQKLVSDALGTTNIEEAFNNMTDIKLIQEKTMYILLNADTLDTTIQAEETIKAEKAARSNAAKTFVNILDTVPCPVSTTSIVAKGNGKADIHTEFGIDSNGNIVFQEDNKGTKTAQVYAELVAQVQNAFRANTEAYNNLGGDAGIKKLVQAAWIMNYTSRASSTTHNATAFVNEVIANLKSILKKLEKNPELFKFYTSHTAYANSSLTNGLDYYKLNNRDTQANDDIWCYDGDNTIADKESSEYNTTMNKLLQRILASDVYSEIDDSILITVFNTAKTEALRICVNNIEDCPYGTGNNSGFVGDTKRNWGGKDSRDDDGWKIKVSELVELTLYFFDKLLYQRMAA